jgi:hypothetical protein
LAVGIIGRTADRGLETGGNTECFK